MNISIKAKVTAAVIAVVLLIIGAIIVISLLLSSSNPVNAQESDIKLYIEGEEFSTSVPIILIDGIALAPFREIADKLGAATEWDRKEQKITSTLDTVTVHYTIGSNIMIKYGQPVDMGAEACFYSDRAMVPIRAIGDAFGYPVTWDEENQAIFLGTVVSLNTNPMIGTTVTDEYRYNEFLGAYSGVNVFSNGTENFGMELISVNGDSAYAETVSKIARSVPDAKVYDIIAPSAQEFYAPSERRTNQTAGITQVYDALLAQDVPNLIPVNVVQTLSDHAAEKIYFNTDHHWTQRGAYYAYQEFCRVNYNIDELDPLESFITQNIYGYKGSMYSFAAGTYGQTLLGQSPDMLQLFFPKTEYEGAAYRDPYMSSYITSIFAIYPWANSYSCFLQGDYPLEVFKTDLNNGKKVCIVKESFGDAFSVWALNNYEEVYVIDYRMFGGGTYGGFGSSGYTFNLSEFYDFVKFDDLIIISYPVSVSVNTQVELLSKMAN